MSFFNVMMLAGLAAVAIPPIIHLLNRRRYDVIDWGAMQFLQVREVTRRRLLIEELVLMALRMALLAVLVLALAGPFFKTTRLAKLGGRPSRDVVLIFDGSHSMAATDATGKKSPHDAAKQWALAFLDDLTPGDTVAVLQAKQQVVPVVAQLSHDLPRVRRAIQALPAPAGGCDWPAALKQAHLILPGSQRAEREVVVLGDGQKHGWADPDTLYRWELLAGELGYSKSGSSDDGPRPRVWAVSLAPERTAQTPNWALTPLSGNRPVVAVKREATFRAELALFGQPGYTPPHAVRLKVDGERVRGLPVPRSAPLSSGKVPLTFRHTFATPGSHLVTLELEADPPPGSRPAGYALKDRVPGDNTQDFAVEVVSALPVLIVDGDPAGTAAAERGSR